LIQPTTFFAGYVARPNDLEVDYNLGKNSDSPPSNEVLKDLKEGKSILHIFTEDEKQIKPNNWEQASLIYPANALKSITGQTYFYAYIDNPDAHNVGKDKIISFRSYLESVA
jgi:hypothetical protein